MTMPASSYSALLTTAKEIDCVGVEVRNDLDGALFDGLDAEQAGRAAQEQDLRLLALSEVSAFNDLSDRAWQDTLALVNTAKACGAEAISLIPRNDGKGCEPVERAQNLKATLIKFAPLLEQHQLLGFIEPLGFSSSSLRLKAEVVSLLTELRLTETYKLVHDTFHHHLSGEGEIFPEFTGMVHISGVVDKALQTTQMQDHHRVLVNEHDRLNNVEQLVELIKRGYDGPISIEAFSPVIHKLSNPKENISECFKYIESNLAA